MGYSILKKDIFSGLLAASLCAFALACPAPARGQTTAEWVKIGERVEGSFTSFVAAGIRIGLDARKRLGVSPGELSVIYIDGAATPCACVADGIMMATAATPGKKTLSVSLVNARREL